MIKRPDKRSRNLSTGWLPIIPLLLVFFFSAGASAQQEGKPNIILLMADDMGWGDVAFNGNTRVKTPNLDEMAKDGIQFTRFYTAAPICSPTRGSILTGRHPFRYGILAAHTGGMRQGEITLAEVCRSNGYRTGFFGKWHLGGVEPEDVRSRGFYSPPWQHGFDETFATCSAVPTWNPTVTPAYFNDWGNKPGEPWNGSVYVHNGQRVTDNLEGDDSRIIMDRAIPFIEEAAASRQPFMTCIWFHAPHEPVVAGPEYLEMYKTIPTLQERHYLGCITALDEQVGRLRKRLREMGIEKNTMIWFCSDNGPANSMMKQAGASAGAFRGRKQQVYEGGIRVPSLLLWPGAVEAGKKVDTRMSTYDYLPSIVELAGLEFNKTDKYIIDGESLVPAITGRGMTRARPVFSAWMRLYQGTHGCAMIGERYKLVVPEHSKVAELYDLSADPYEQVNIAAKHPDIVKRMSGELQQWEVSCRLSRDGQDYAY